MAKKKSSKLTYFDVMQDPTLREQWHRQVQEEDYRRSNLFREVDPRRATYFKPNFLIEDFLPEGYLCILAGDPKHGKSWLATAMAHAIATGTPFAGQPTKQAKVLWLALEEGPTERHTILKHIPLPPSGLSWREGLGEGGECEPLHSTGNPPSGSSWREGLGEGGDCEHVHSTEVSEEDDSPDTLETSPGTNIFDSYERITIDTEDGIADLQYWVTETNAKLIVIDPLQSAHSGRSLQDGWAARKTLRRIKDFCVQKNIAAIVLHHLTTRGAKRIADSAQLSAIASMFIMLTPLTPLPLTQNFATPSVPQTDPSNSNTDKSNTSYPSDTSYQSDSPSGTRESGNYFPPESNCLILRLECRGRGDFANRTLHLRSTAPLHYEPITIEEKQEREKPINPIEQAVLDTLEEKGPLCASSLIARVNAAPGSVRNAVTRLYNRGDIRVAYTAGKTRYFGLQVQNEEQSPKFGSEFEEFEEFNGSDKAKKEPSPAEG